MRFGREPVLTVLSFFVALSVFSTKTTAASFTTQSLIQGLSPAQKSLLYGYQLTHQRALQTTSINENGFGAERLQLDLSTSQLTTLTAITHALEHTRLADGTSALSIVRAVTEIHGRIKRASLAHQYNISVIWRDDAVTKFQQAGFQERVGWGHGGMWGMSYHTLPLGLHVLFSKKDNRVGSIHVDYRNFGFYVWRGRPEGHFSLRDVDVTAVGPDIDHSTGKPINNAQRHEQWFGTIPGLAP
jgi:hypothetical protein